MREFDQTNEKNVKTFKFFSRIIILLMTIGLATVLFRIKEDSISSFIIQGLLVVLISLLLLLYPKKESEKAKAALVFSVTIYFYTLFFLFPETSSTYILICMIPALSIIIFNKKIFYFIL